MKHRLIHILRTGSSRFLLPVPVILILSTLHCLQTVPPETGVLQLSLSWDQPPESAAAEKTALVDVQSIMVTAEPGEATATFFSWDSALNMDLALGIYNLSVRALDNDGRTLYEGEAAKVLVQPLETTPLSVAMSSRFPAEAPQFIAPADTGYSSDGTCQLLWSTCACAETYVLQESTDASFTSPEQIYSGADTAFTVTGLDEGTWYYRVQGENDLAASAWSEPAIFVVSYAPELTITADTLAAAEQGAFYADSVTVSGGTPPCTWSITAGALPYGLSLDSATGVISGTPTAVDAWSFTVSVTDAGTPAQTVSREFSISVDPAPLHITTESPLPNGIRNAAYSQNITAEGGSSNWSWELIEGTLPAGMVFRDKGETGSLGGAPSESGTFTFTVAVSDIAFPWLSDEKEFSLTIKGPAALGITTGSLPDGRADQFYSTTLQAAGGTPPYTWSEDSRTGGGFVEGISLSSDGLLSGMPNPQPETGSFTFRVTDSGSPAQSATQTLSLTIDPGPLSLLGYSLTGTAGEYFNGSIMYRYGTGPLQTPWTITGDWPEDVVISYGASNYQMSITGTPTTSGTYNFNVTIYDSGSPQQSRTDSFTITIN